MINSHYSIIMVAFEYMYTVKFCMIWFLLLVVLRVPPELAFLHRDGRTDLDLLRQDTQENTSNQDSRASLLITQKNRKIKNPWKALRITKMNWKAVETSGSPNPVTVSPPKIHVRPKRNVIPAILMSKRTVFFLLICLLERLFIFQWCFINTVKTIADITMLKSRMTKMGPRKAPKKTAGLEMKQLKEEENRP